MTKDSPKTKFPDYFFCLKFCFYGKLSVLLYKRKKTPTFKANA